MSEGRGSLPLDALVAWCRFITRDALAIPAVSPDDLAARRPALDVLLANRLGPALDLAVARSSARLPAPFLAAVRDDARRAAEEGLASIATLGALAAALDEARVPWLLWKGPALSLQVWGDATRRHHTDLDIVVPPTARRAARAALARAGWRAADGLPPRTERAVRAREAAFPLERAGGRLVELHWAFGAAVHPQPLDPAAVLARADVVRVGGVEVRTPGGSDALLLLASHATKHGWSQAEEVLSFARLAERRPEALPEARATAVRAGVPRVIALAERLALRLLGDAWACSTRIQDEMVARVFARAGSDAAAVERMADACLARMCAGDGAWRETHGWTMSWMSRRSDRARYLAGALLRPTPQEPRWLRLPDALAGAYPAVRVMRLTLRALGVAR